MENKMNFSVNEKAGAENKNMKKNNNENENELKNATLKTKQGNLKNGTETDNFQQEQPIIGEKFRKPIDKSVDDVENSFKEKKVPEYVPENTENEKPKEDMMTKVQNVVNSIGQFSGPVQQLFSKKNNNKTFTSSEIEEENKLSSLNQLKDKGKGKGNWTKNALPIILGLIIMLALIAIFTKLFKKKENQKTNNDKENLQGNTSTEQGNTSTEQGNTSTEQGNTSTEQGNTSKEQGNTSKEQGNTSKEQGNTSKEQGNKVKFTIGSKEKNSLKTKQEHIKHEENGKNKKSKSDLANKVKESKPKNKKNNKKENVIS